MLLHYILLFTRDGVIGFYQDGRWKRARSARSNKVKYVHGTVERPARRIRFRGKLSTASCWLLLLHRPAEETTSYFDSWKKESKVQTKKPIAPGGHVYVHVQRVIMFATD